MHDIQYMIDLLAFEYFDKLDTEDQYVMSEMLRKCSIENVRPESPTQ